MQSKKGREGGSTQLTHNTFTTPTGHDTEKGRIDNIIKRGVRLAYRK